MRARLGLFARLPVPGVAKTRLIPALGAEGAAALHEAMLRRTVATAGQLALGHGIGCTLFGTGGGAEAFASLSEGMPCRCQGEGDLGARLLRAFDALLAEADAAAIAGTDCPELSAAILAEAFLALRHCDLVLGPALDGGYYLVGMRRRHPELFCDMPWSTPALLGLTLQRAARLGLRVRLLPPLQDVDRPTDLPVWERIASAPVPRLSVIIPALDEAACIGAAVRGVLRPEVEVIVADGGSSDATMEQAVAAGARVLRTPRGRGAQLAAGAALARAPALLFLHADTSLPADPLAWIERTLADPRVALGAFRLQIDGAGLALRAIEAAVRLRCAVLRTPYGDQALFLRASTLRAMGGVRPLPLFEDVDLVARARKHGRIAIVPAAALTSARRWRRGGVLRTTLKNRLCALGFALGIAPPRLHAFREALWREPARSVHGEGTGSTNGGPTADAGDEQHAV